MNNIYEEHGHKNRHDYLQSLADQYDVDITMVEAAAELLGPSEDFDGLVSTLNDIS